MVEKSGSMMSKFLSKDRKEMPDMFSCRDLDAADKLVQHGWDINHVQQMKRGRA